LAGQGRAESSDGGVSGAVAAGAVAAGAVAAGAPGMPPLASAGRSPGSDSCGGTFSGRPGSAGIFTRAAGVAGATGAAGVAAAGMPGIETGRPGIAGVAGAAGAAGAPAKPGIELSPGIAELAAGAKGEAAAGAVIPGRDGIAAGEDADVAPVAGVSPGKVMPGVAGAAGGVAPSAVARFCRICGALAAEAISCCGMFGKGSGTAGTGSAWAIPPVNSAADEPTTTAVARK
jgi:hypothetical protein